MSAAEPTAAVVIIGAEVLSGKVLDENAPYLIKALRQRGVEVAEIRTIGDGVEIIGETVRLLAAKHDHVFTTGGIGPTHDDVTIAGVAHAFGVEVVRHPIIEAQLRGYFGERLVPAHLKMAEVPTGAEIIEVRVAAVPIIRMRNVLVFPGVPSLMRRCFEEIALQFSGPPFVTAALLLDTSESIIAAHLDAVQQRYPANAIGSYPRFDPGAPYRVKVTVDGRDLARVAEVFAALRAGLPPSAIIGEELPHT